MPLWALPPVQWVAILVPFVILGWLITGPFDLTNTEEHANTWFVSHRTSRLNDLASTEGIAIVFGLAALFLVIRHRWSSFSLLVWALTAELSLFLVINLIVGRPRPDVVALDSVPRTSSFPSRGETPPAVIGAQPRASPGLCAGAVRRTDTEEPGPLGPGSSVRRPPDQSSFA